MLCNYLYTRELRYEMKGKELEKKDGIINYKKNNDL